MSQRPTWFGPSERPLFGWLHLPDGGKARGAIVCCPPLGTEALSSYRALRQLAVELEAAGFAVLRFDYAGTGDSAGAGDEEALGAWRASIRQALTFVRRLGLERTGLVGLRLGATLAAFEAAADGNVDAVALWDPCASGRSFVREQRALRAVSIEQESPSSEESGSTELLGWVLGPTACRQLESLRLDDLELPLAGRSMLLTRDDRPLGPVLRRWREHPSFECGEAAGQKDLIDVLPNLSVVPWETVTLLRRWFERSMAGRWRPVDLATRSEALIEADEDVTVCERAARLGHLGLFAMVCEPLGERSAATVVFLNAGIMHHIGPARLWVTLSRQLAARGIRAIRLDLSGLGESPVRPGQRPHLVHPLEAMDDVALAFEGLGLAPNDVVLAGLCSGAYHAIEAGLRFPLRGVCAVNPILVFDPPEVVEGAALDPQRQAVAPFRGWIRHLRRFSRLAAWGEHRAPAGLWWLIDRLGLQANPACSFQELAERAVPLALVCGEVEARPFLRRARWTMRSLLAQGALSLDLLEESDHALFGAAARGRAVRHILDRLSALATSGAVTARPAWPSGREDLERAALAVEEWQPA